MPGCETKLVVVSCPLPRIGVSKNSVSDLNFIAVKPAAVQSEHSAKRRAIICELLQSAMEIEHPPGRNDSVKNGLAPGSIVRNPVRRGALIRKKAGLMACLREIVR
jgi:hypothetical protein